MIELFDNVGKIDKATNGQEAFECVRDNEHPNEERTYDMIFIDLEMPIKNGFEACEMIRKHYTNIQEEKKINFIEEESKDERQNKEPNWLNDLNKIYK